MDIEKRRATKRKYQSTPEYRAYRKEYMRKWALANKEKMKASRQKWARRWNVRRALREAVKVGRVQKLPCEKCGSVMSEGHHADYSKPLEVLWLCRKHHAERHRA